MRLMREERVFVGEIGLYGWYNRALRNLDVRAFGGARRE
jgi:hypothetical protein